MRTTVPFYVADDDPPAKQAILRAALKLFSTKGLVSTSVRDIAAESGYTNPALYKHFASKDRLALHLFNTCHARVWNECAAALEAGPRFEHKLEAYVRRWLELVDEHPDVIAFLSDSARALWPRASARVRRHTLIDLARTLVRAAHPASRASRGRIDVAAACLEGTLAELARMIQVGVVDGPAIRWQDALVALFRRLMP